MAKVDCKIVEQEVNEMFEEHKTTQGVVEALLIETGWDATRSAPLRKRQKKQEAISEQEEKKKEKKEAPQKLIQRLAQEQNGASPR